MCCTEAESNYSQVVLQALNLTLLQESSGHRKAQYSITADQPSPSVKVLAESEIFQDT